MMSYLPMALNKCHYLRICQGVHGLVLMVLLVLILWFQEGRPINSWVAVKAQVIDATVVQQIENNTIQSVLNGFWVQYVYRYTWHNQAYVSRGLIQQSVKNQPHLTSNEMRVKLLAEHSQSEQLAIWVNPDSPNQSVLVQPANRLIIYLSLSGMLILTSWFFWSFRFS